GCRSLLATFEAWVRPWHRCRRCLVVDGCVWDPVRGQRSPAARPVDSIRATRTSGPPPGRSRGSFHAWIGSLLGNRICPIPAKEMDRPRYAGPLHFPRPGILHRHLHAARASLLGRLRHSRERVSARRTPRLQPFATTPMGSPYGTSMEMFARSLPGVPGVVEGIDAQKSVLRIDD